MRNHSRSLGASMLIAGLCAGPAAAQNANPTPPARIGSNLSYHFDVRDPGLGAQLDVPVGSRIALYPSGAVYLVDSGSLVGLNADLKYRLPAAMYVGGGLNILHRSLGDSGDTDAGVNMLGGIEGSAGRFRPFAEGRVILNDGSAFQLAAGLNVLIG